MKKIFAAVLFAATTTVFASADVEIKGLKLGMTREEVQALHPAGTKGEIFTVAGVKSKYAHSNVEQYNSDGKVIAVMFFFDRDNFEQVFDAVKGKYPKMNCETSSVSNAMGATFQKIECRHGSLKITNMVSDINTSLLSIVDAEHAIKAVNERRAQSRGDL